MKLLILGGTVFVGRHLVETALRRGHEVSIFNRGQHTPDLYPNVEKLRGDRDGDLRALEGRRWDAAIDTSGYVPRLVRASAELLAGAVDHYTFISTLSVYSDVGTPGIDEHGKLGTLADETVEEITGETYGPLKVLCERAVEQAFPDRAFIPRPSLIVGPHDATDRFTYWPHRVSRGGEVLAPDPPEAPIQFVDVRDVAEWTICMVESRQTGIYNVTGPDYVLTMGRLLEECRMVTGSDARFTWVDGRFLMEAGVSPWTDIPIWVGDDEDVRGFHAVDCGKAIAAGLCFRPLAKTIRETIAWDATRPADTEWRAGLKPEREAELLRSWHMTR